MALIDNIVAAWKLDEASGNAVDSSWAGLTLTNNWTMPYATGKLWNAADTSNGKYLSHSTFLDAGLTAWTCSYWIKTTMSATAWYIIDKTSTNHMYPFETLINASNKAQVYINPVNSSWQNAWTSDTSINTWAWFHIIISWDNSWRDSIKMYINWTLDWSLTTSGNDSWAIWANTLNDFRIGARSDNNFPFTWQIDEVCFWSRVLTEAERTSLYNWWTGLTYPFASGNFFQFIM